MINDAVQVTSLHNTSKLGSFKKQYSAYTTQKLTFKTYFKFNCSIGMGWKREYELHLLLPSNLSFMTKYAWHICTIKQIKQQDIVTNTGTFLQFITVIMNNKRTMSCRFKILKQAGPDYSKWFSVLCFI